MRDPEEEGEPAAQEGQEQAQEQAQEQQEGSDSGIAARAGNRREIYAVQCCVCKRWRIIPSKATYEAIRERWPEKPWTCDQARGWRPEICCSDSPDLKPDRSAVWAIDKPGIPSPPQGWNRVFLFFNEGSTKLGQVLYRSPCGKTLRNGSDVKKFLHTHPDYADAGIRIEQFCFTMPKPLDPSLYKRNHYFKPPNPLKMRKTSEAGRSAC